MSRREDVESHIALRPIPFFSASSEESVGHWMRSNAGRKFGSRGQTDGADSAFGVRGPVSLGK